MHFALGLFVKSDLGQMLEKVLPIDREILYFVTILRLVVNSFSIQMEKRNYDCHLQNTTAGFLAPRPYQMVQFNHSGMHPKNVFNRMITTYYQMISNMTFELF